MYDSNYREATENYEIPNPVNVEVVEKLRPAPLYEIGDQPSSLDEYEMPMLDRNFSRSTHHSTLSGPPSAPDLFFSQVATNEQKGIDTWVLAQQRQIPYDLTKVLKMLLYILQS